MKTQKQKNLEYDSKYSHIPRDYNERIAWMVDEYNISPKVMDDIIMKKRNMEYNLDIYDYFCVIYRLPEAKPRPRYRFNRATYANVAMSNPQFISVYSPGAAGSKSQMKRLLNEELIELQMFVQTPCSITLNIFEQTPSSFNRVDKILAEYGLIPNIGSKDADNFLKKTQDDMNSLVFLDDRLIVSATVNKLYSILPREEVYIRYLNYVPNKVQYNTISKLKDFKEDYQISYLDNVGNIFDIMEGK